MNPEQMARIVEMEAILDTLAGQVASLNDTLGVFRTVQPELRRLIAYYESDAWRQDFEDDLAGRLPTELKRGVLSEDAVYDLLTDYASLLESMEEIVGAERGQGQ